MLDRPRYSIVMPKISLSAAISSSALELALFGRDDVDPRLSAHAVPLSREACPPNTRRTYLEGVTCFENWARSYGFEAVPASGETIALFMADNAQRLKLSTMKTRIAAVSVAHQKLGLPCGRSNYVVREMARAIARVYGNRPQGKDPMRLSVLRELIRTIRNQDNLARALRDAALFLLQYAAALRSAEMDFCVEHIEFTDFGLELTLVKSKTDPQRWGHVLTIARGAHRETCPVRALKRWLEYSGITDGPIFRGIHRSGVILPSAISTRSIIAILKGYLEKMGLNDGTYGTHSLRSGPLTTGFEKGLSDAELMVLSRHITEQNLMAYLRKANLAKRNLTAAIGM